MGVCAARVSCAVSNGARELGGGGLPAATPASRDTAPILLAPEQAGHEVPDGAVMECNLDYLYQYETRKTWIRYGHTAYLGAPPCEDSALPGPLLAVWSCHHQQLVRPGDSLWEHAKLGAPPAGRRSRDQSPPRWPRGRSSYPRGQRHHAYSAHRRLCSCPDQPPRHMWRSSQPLLSHPCRVPLQRRH